ncbi:MAG: DUF1467 family protein [Rhodovibrionaceae bacterium]
MGWFTGFIVYAIIWWVILLAVLPWGVRREENPEAGHDPGAPSNPNLPKKLLATTLVSAAVWLVVFLLIEGDLFSFRQAVQDWWRG